MIGQREILQCFFFLSFYLANNAHVYRYLVSNTPMNGRLDAYAPHFAVRMPLILNKFLWKCILCTIKCNVQCHRGSFFTFSYPICYFNVFYKRTNKTSKTIKQSERKQWGSYFCCAVVVKHFKVMLNEPSELEIIDN